ncbi:hypothetical protein M422DRAFT_245215 [Sphaerobolus stellatus SS14]|nr:hypothetical protein M422DRAFT_245215 [Sphaerobolus stellatus SS14]
MSTHHNCKWAEELSAAAVGEDEPIPGLTAGELMDPPPSSVDLQQSSEVTKVRGHMVPKLYPSGHSPLLGGKCCRYFCTQSTPIANSGHDLGGAPDESDHAPPDEGVEAMEATEWLNTVFNQIRTSMNRMSPMMKDIFLVPKQKSSGKTIEPGNNRAHDKAAAKAATKRIVTQGATSIPITGM